MARVNRLVTAATAYLASIEGRSRRDLTDIEYLAELGARTALRNNESTNKWRRQNIDHYRKTTRDWIAKHPDRYACNSRIHYLRKAIEKLEGKPASPRTDWPARRLQYQEELADLEKERT